MHKPNLIVPLANSYNERGVLGFTHTVTNSEDQRKINCMYEVSRNSITGVSSLNLSKRPGVTNYGASFGSSSQSSYLVSSAPGTRFTVPWLFSKLSNDIRVSDESTTTTVVTSSAYIPVFTSRTAISGLDTLILQCRDPSIFGANRVFFNSGTISTSWTEITDADFTALSMLGKMENMDGYAFVLTSTNTIANSDLNSLANWTATNSITKQIVQDVPVGLARLKNQILAFGAETMEAFYNAGNPSGSPLSSIKQLHQRVGMIAGLAANQTGHYYAILGNKLYFIGTYGNSISMAGLFVYDGANVERASTRYIDKILSEHTGILYSVNAFVFNGKEAISISFTIPTAAGTHRWLMFFPEWKEWFEWTSTTFSPINDSVWFLGVGANNNKLFNFSNDVWQDDGTSYQFATQFKLPGGGPDRKRMVEFGVIGDTKAANTLTVEVSDDDYANFTTRATLDLSTARKSTTRGGTYIDRAIRLSNTNALETRLQSFTALVK